MSEALRNTDVVQSHAHISRHRSGHGDKLLSPTDLKSSLAPPVVQPAPRERRGFQVNRRWLWYAKVARCLSARAARSARAASRGGKFGECVCVSKTPECVNIPHCIFLHSLAPLEAHKPPHACTFHQPRQLAHPAHVPYAHTLSVSHLFFLYPMWCSPWTP